MAATSIPRKSKLLLPDDDLGQVPYALVQPGDGVQLDEETVRQFVTDQVAGYPASRAPPHCGRNSSRRFRLRVMADAGEFGNLGPR